MRIAVFAGAAFLVLAGCDAPTTADAGAAADGGRSDPDASTGRDTGPADDAGPAEDAGEIADAGNDPDAGSAVQCPCFGSTEIAAVEAHAVSNDRGCQVAVVAGNVTTSALSSTAGAQVNQLDNVESVGFAGTDYRCAAGCSDSNDDGIDDCIGAPLPAYTSMLIDEAQYDACEALLEQACR